MSTPGNSLNIKSSGLVNFDASTPSFSAVTVTQHDVLVGGASNAITSVSPSTAGLVLTSNGVSADPSFQSLAASGAITSITGNSGGAEVPSAGNFNILGTGSITVAGSANTETVQLTGLTNHNVLVGAGTATITSVAPSTSNFVLTSNGASADPSFQAISASGALTTINGDSGSITPTAGAVTIYAHHSTTNCGSSVLFVNSGSTSTLNVTDSSSNTIIGSAAGGTSITTGNENTALGKTALGILTSGIGNAVVGYQAGLQIQDGSYNACLGFDAGASIISGSSNVLLNNSGSGGLANTLRIGTGTGTGQQQLNAAFIHGITGIAPTGANAPQVVLCDNASQLTTITSSTSGFVLTSNGAGTTPTFKVLPAAGGGITTIQTDAGNVTAISSIVIFNSANLGTSFNTAQDGVVTNQVDFGCFDANINIFLGGGSTTVVGGGGTQNVGAGSGCFQSLVTGSSNTGIGGAAGGGVGVLLPDGSNNCFFGDSAGSGYTSTESSNILIGSQNAGISNDNNVLRIGNATGTSTGNLNQAFICGINGTVVTGVPVLVSASDQLGVGVSSRKYKDNIQDMGDFSSDLSKLRPVTFNPKGDPTTQCVGLIAEEVDEVYPSLVSYDKEGDPQAVRYHDLPAMLLNELQKLQKRVAELEARLGK